MPGFRARRNKRVSGSKFTFQIAEHACHVRDLRAGRASPAVVSGGPGRAEGRGQGGGHSRAAHALVGKAARGGAMEMGIAAWAKDRADGESNSGCLHFALFRNRGDIANRVALHFNHCVLEQLSCSKLRLPRGRVTRASPRWRGAAVAWREDDTRVVSLSKNFDFNP